MRRGGNLPWMLALACAVGGVSCEKKTETEIVTVSPDASPLLAGLNVYQFHLTAAQQDVANCIGCHGDMSNQRSLAEGTKAFHPRHAEATPQYTCTTCHVSVDLLEKSGAAVRKQASPSLCASCHGPGGLASNKFFESQ